LHTPPVLAAEDQLVAQLRARDRAALNLVYKKYSAALYGVALKVVKDESLAEDVLQEGFVKIWSSIDSYNEEKGRLFTWMLNICRNLAIDKLRSRQSKQSRNHFSVEDKHERIADESATFSADHIGLREVTEKLRPEQKQLIDLLYFNGFTHTEAAEELNLPLGTVKTRVRTALKVLAKLLS